MINRNFYIIKDKKDNDIIYINDKNIIYTNINSTSIEYQKYLYYKYLNKGICNIYTINDNLSVIKQETKKNIFWYLKDKKSQRIIYNSDINDQCAIYFNDYYLVLATLEYGAGVDEFVYGYDIEKSKDIEFDYNTEDYIYKYLVQIRGCTKENLLGLINGMIYNKDMMYSFMSFILDEEINSTNYYIYLNVIKSYILKLYPNLNDKDDLCNIYYFHRMPKKIDFLKYKKKTYAKKR